MKQRTDTYSAAKPSDFSDSVRFLKALPKTGPKKETSEKQPKLPGISTFRCRSPVFSLFSATEGTNHCTVKSRQSAPTSSTLQVGRGGWASPTCRIQCYMQKYSPYENCSCISYTDQGSRARRRTDPTKRRVCAIPGQEGGHCCVHFQRGRARVCSAVRHHRLRQSHTRIQSITSLTRSQGGGGRMGETGRSGGILRYYR